MKASVQIVRNILSNWGAVSIGVIIQFFMMPFVIHRLGDVHYGIWVLILSVTGFLDLFDLGVSGSVVKYVAEYRAKGDNEGLNSICSTAFYIFLVAGTVVLLLSFVLSSFVQFFRIPRDEILMSRWIMLIVGFQIGLTLPSGFFTGYMRGIQRYDHVAAIRLTFFCVRSFFIVAFVSMGYGLITMALIQLMSTIVGGATRAIYVYRANPGLRLRIDLISRDKFAMVGRYSILIFLYFLAQRLVFSAGGLVIGYYLTAAAITFYAIPQRLVDELRVLIMSTGVLQPTVSHLNAQGQNMKVQKVLVNGTKYSMMIVLPIAASYIVVGDIFISLWMGQRYAAACYGVLVVLTCAVVANVSQFTSTQILQGIARHGSTAYITIFEAAANLALSIVLVKKYGIIGVAVGTLIPMLCSNLIVIPWYTCRAVHFSMPRFFKEGLLIPCIPALLFGAVLWTASRMITIDNWMEFIAVLAVSLGFYIILSCRLCLSREERMKRWKDVSSVIRSGTLVIRSVVLSLRSRAEKSIP